MWRGIPYGVNEAALGCGQAALLVNPGPTCYTGMLRDTGLVDVPLVWTHASETQDRGKLHSHQSRSAHQGLQQRGFPSFPKKRVCP